MTWGIMNNCNQCAKTECADAVKIQEGVYAAHTSGGQHQGQGTVIMFCTNFEKKTCQG